MESLLDEIEQMELRSASETGLRLNAPHNDWFVAFSADEMPHDQSNLEAMIAELNKRGCCGAYKRIEDGAMEHLIIDPQHDTAVATVQELLASLEEEPLLDDVLYWDKMGEIIEHLWRSEGFAWRLYLCDQADEESRYALSARVPSNAIRELIEEYVMQNC